MIRLPVAALRRIEWPTVGVAALVYGGWIMATLQQDRLPSPILAGVGGWLVAWHGSLQHETIHGHPTPWRRLNALLACAPLSLWLPYPLYRRSHLAHHAAEHLTDPRFDPEARYLPPGAGTRRIDSLAARLQATLLGRIVLGPVIETLRFLVAEAGRVFRGEQGARRVWAVHLIGVGAVWAWLHFACGMSLGRYVLTFVYPGLALTLVRSFAEHRADPSPHRRVAVVERAPVFGLLFLNNNLHATHHAWPGAAWWRLPGLYAAERAAFASGRGGPVYRGYREVFERYLFQPHDRVEHPGSAEAPLAVAVRP